MTQQATTSEAAGKGNGVVAYLRSNIRDYMLLLALVAIMIFFQIATNGTLFKPVNLTNLILQNSYIIIMALGMLLIIVAGHIDLSVGSVVGFVGAVAAIMMVHWKIDFVTTSIVCVLVGAAIGAAQGSFVAFLKIPAFIVTLAGMLIFKGLSLWLLSGQSVGPFPGSFQMFGSGFIPNIFPTIAPVAVEGGAPPGPPFHLTSLVIGVLVAAALVYYNLRQRQQQQKHDVADEPLVFFLGRNILLAGAFVAFSYLMASAKGLPNVLIIMFALITLYAFVTTSTTIGRRVYALGGNEKAARLSGINTPRLTFYAFVNMGVLAALAGLIFAARLNTATPKAGAGFELDVIAACFIGGASPYGGVGKVIGAVIGAFIMGVMNNGMSIMGVNIDWQQVIKGGVLLSAVCLDVYYRNKG